MAYDLIIVAGEPSGDEHAGAVLRELKKLNPHLKIAAVCGPHMKKAYKLEEILHIDQLSIMGFMDVLKNIFKLWGIYRKILNFILKNPSKLVLFVDYPGMNLQLAKKLRAKGQKSLLWHYIAPTAWAWKKNRVKTLSKNIDELFCILPFEEKFFQSHHVNATYIGHPLISKLQNSPLHENKDPQLISIFPGSRSHEISKNLEMILKACQIHNKKHPSHHYAISCAKPSFYPTIHELVQRSPLFPKIAIYDQKDTETLMQTSSLAIAKSGTCNLELALFGTPTIVVYAISKLDVFIAKTIFGIDLPFYSLPNLILNEEMFKELYGPLFNEHTLYLALEKTIEKKEDIKSQMNRLKATLGSKNPSVELAKKIYLNL